MISALVSENRERYSLQEKYDEGYKTESEQVKVENERRREEYNTDFPQWETSNNDMLSALNTSLNSANGVLEQYYSADVIFPK